MAQGDTPAKIDRRTLLIGGGAGVGLIVAWAVWPRSYAPNLTPAKGETVFGAWLKIGVDGHVTVAVPQAEHGQGVYTTLPQIVADELGADWRTVSVQPAPLNPLYANALAASELFGGAFGALPAPLRATHAQRSALVLTGGSSSVRAFEGELRAAGAAARIMLSKAAAKRWGVDWQSTGTAAGFVVHGTKKLRFAELVAEAAHQKIPSPIPLRGGDTNRLYGQSLPRLDVPAKVDGSANFAGDIRLPDMVFAAIRQGPIGDSKLIRVDRAAADRIRGVLSVVTNDGWVAAIANNWWAANKALDALSPRFETRGAIISSATIDTALNAALDGPGTRMAALGDLGPVFKGANVVTAQYRAGLAVHAAIETMTATAHYHDGRLELWLPTQAPGLARGAAAAVLGISENDVVVHPMLIGGSFGANLEHQVAEQAALLAERIKRPVQLVWSRSEDLLHDRYRPPAAARMSARLGPNGQILGWLAKIAAPSTGHEIAGRLLSGDTTARALLATSGGGDAYAVAGARPFYRLPAYAIDHHPAEIGVPTGHWRSGAHSYTAFFTECFLDELAHVAGTEPLSYRIGMLGGDARLARCLSTAAALGGWEGGVPGSGQGIACHAFRGSYIAVLAEAHIGDDQRPVVDRLVAAVDCGRQVNPDVVLQAIEGGLIFGMAAALGGATEFTENLADARGFGDLALPRLADTPDITIEMIRSEADPGGVSELAVPPVAPAIANALQAATGFRMRTLPLRPGDA
ncbi:xanthine dehydrogenase family protein molybdopterin-binding subunit [Sphingomonas alpina]|uniref:Xanthine dehydrogenase family protein molybdopterin-binding subunit n=1 Tax=Sphingomonas alpina TaxID=653931 RepID=A0A7H0LIA4_9SPHN|nr:molybdopterin cofactor-binding domain-containing protein [Sphingomonas alpina]QNQ09407.1 xanthine dehydrogenase family protein molybdopterin-binding subunit [Sphingomonas alpina]